MTVTTHAITDEQVASYHEKGYLVVPNALSESEVEELRSVTEEMQQKANGLTSSNNVYDIDEERSTPERAWLRRIKAPNRHHPFYEHLTLHEGILNILSRVLGPNIRLYGTKLNMKDAGAGEAVEWHQDWAFFPHTNDDILNVGIPIDDIDEDNGPLIVVPGSHKGPIYDHSAGGHFVGAIDPETSGADFSQGEALVCKAGSITLHHVRSLHGSAINRSSKRRRLLLHIYSAADAWPVVGCGVPGGRGCPGQDYHGWQSKIVLGEDTDQPRMEALPVRLPLPGPEDSSSVFTTQSGMQNRYFR
jgi:ectoine hydroxylase-related dioxygenase (phytanoyl-CoA dioxygenase family)